MGCRKVAHYFIMELLLLKCENCGAELKGGDGSLLRCEYCGSEHLVSTSGKSQCTIKFGELISVQSSGSDVFVPSGVTRISERAFADCKSLRNVFLPETVSEIGDEAFINCVSLLRVNLPASLIKIGNRAFKNSGLKEVTLCKTIKSVGEEAFMGCVNLGELTIDSGFEFALTKTFKGCENLQKVNCDLNDFFPSFKRGIETNRKGSVKPTFFDAFQSTPFFSTLYNNCIKSNVCVKCGGNLKTPFLSSGRHKNCKLCGIKIEY